uniref:Uncharacterized protein n=1 Tax=Glossina brevipalpis TaxID=37001 RepID=A0A1A9WG60_9MUSC
MFRLIFVNYTPCASSIFAFFSTLVSVLDNVNKLQWIHTCFCICTQELCNSQIRNIRYKMSTYMCMDGNDFMEIGFIKREICIKQKRELHLVYVPTTYLAYD